MTQHPCFEQPDEAAHEGGSISVVSEVQLNQGVQDRSDIFGLNTSVPSTHTRRQQHPLNSSQNQAPTQFVFSGLRSVLENRTTGNPTRTCHDFLGGWNGSSSTKDSSSHYDFVYRVLSEACAIGDEVSAIIDDMDVTERECAASFRGSNDLL